MLAGYAYGFAFGSPSSASTTETGGAPIVATAPVKRRGVLPALDLVGLMLDELPEPLQRTRWRELAAACARPFQTIYDTLVAIEASRKIDVAVGAQLDQIGAIVIQPRDTLDDAVYRQRIRAKIAVNRSVGVIDDVARIARLVLNSAAPDIVVDSGGATVTLEISGVPIEDMLAADLAGFGRRVVSAGVRFLALTTVDVDAETFVLGWIHDVIDGSYLAGATQVSVLNDDGQLATWPDSGKLKIDGNVYSYAKSGTSTALNISPGLASALSGGEDVAPYVVGKGLSDSTETGHPVLYPYADIGTTGGRLADVR